MNQHSVKKIFACILLASSGFLLANSCSNTCDSKTVSCYPHRSQSRYKMRQVVGMAEHTHEKEHISDEKWGTFSLTPGYHQTFKPKDIARCLFNGDLTDGCDCDGRAIKIQGSSITGSDRDPKAWLADYFYLPRDHDSTVTFEPKIKNFIMDFDLYVGLDKWLEGAYLRVHGPLVHTRWSLGMNEKIAHEGTLSHLEGYFTPNELNNAHLLKSFKAYAQGDAPIDLTTSIVLDDGSDNPYIPDTLSESFYNTFNPLACAKMDCCTRSKTGFADLRFELGWNFYKNEDYHLGAAVTVAAPTGNACCPQWMFDAVVGNNNHWEFGGVITGHYVLWRSQDMEKQLGFYLDANITHMAENEQQRTFDLKNKPNSKYMLASQFGKRKQSVFFGSLGDDDNNDNFPGRVFSGEYAPVANLTTVNVNVSYSVQADIVAWFNYTTNNISWDLGYNFYARGCEDFECKQECNPCEDRKPSLCNGSQLDSWALKGDARMYGYADINTTNLRPIELSTTQSKADIHNGTEQVALTNSSHSNANADNPRVAGTIGNYYTPAIQRSRSDNSTINTSIQPILLTCEDIDFAKAKSISHSVFAHVNYNFESNDTWQPYFGIGGMVEFGSNDDGNDKQCDTKCDSCLKCTPSSWGVWVKGGIAFD